MVKRRMPKIKLPRKVSVCPLEYTDKEFKLWLGNYVIKLEADKKMHKPSFQSDPSTTSALESKVHSSRSVNWGVQESATSREFNPFAESRTSLPGMCFHPECNFVYNLQDPLKRSSLISECVPHLTYQKLAPVLGLDPDVTPQTVGNRCKMQDSSTEEAKVEDFIHLIETEIGVRSDISDDLQVNPGTWRDSVTHDPLPSTKIDNPYLKYIKKISRTISEEEARQNLGRRSGEITKMIIQDFLDWYQSLGGDHKETSIDESTLQELFQIGFDMPAAKSLAIRIKEMPTVPECLAALRNEPEHATRAALKKYLMQDISAEERSPRMYAFGKLLPKERPALRFRPPRNQVRKTWLECKRVPEELDTMKTVWGGIENLRSTIAFSNWLKNHPLITPPVHLKENGLLDIDYQHWMQMYKGFEVEVESEEGKETPEASRVETRTPSAPFEEPN